jgi:protease-4
MARLLALRSAPYHRSTLSAAALLSPSKLRHSASFPHPARRLLRVPARAIQSSSSSGATKQEDAPPAAGDAQEPLPAAPAFVVEELGWGTQLAVKLRMLVAPPWQRVRKGSVLTMKLRGEVGCSTAPRAC